MTADAHQLLARHFPWCRHAGGVEVERATSRVSAWVLQHLSRSLLRKLGFVEEGYAREYLRINGSWQDHVLYGLLKPELRAAAPQA